MSRLLWNSRHWSFSEMKAKNMDLFQIPFVQLAVIGIRRQLQIWPPCIILRLVSSEMAYLGDKTLTLEPKFVRWSIVRKNKLWGKRSWRSWQKIENKEKIWGLMFCAWYGWGPPHLALLPNWPDTSFYCDVDFRSKYAWLACWDMQINAEWFRVQIAKSRFGFYEG